MDSKIFLISVCMTQLYLVHGISRIAMHEDIGGAMFESVPNERFPHLDYKPDGIMLCSGGECSKKVTYEELKSSYGSSFSSILDYSRKTKLPYKCPTCSMAQETSDRSLFCPTHSYGTYYDKKENTIGQECSILQIPGLNQMVTEGFCGDIDQRCGSGTCTQMYSVHSLVAWNHETNEYGQEFFDIPTYCTCMNLTPDRHIHLLFPDIPMIHREFLRRQK